MVWVFTNLEASMLWATYLVLQSYLLTAVLCSFCSRGWAQMTGEKRTWAYCVPTAFLCSSQSDIVRIMVAATYHYVKSLRKSSIFHALPISSPAKSTLAELCNDDYEFANEVQSSLLYFNKLNLEEQSGSFHSQTVGFQRHTVAWLRPYGR